MSQPVKNAEGATFQLAMLTAAGVGEVQCIALVGADGQPITAWPLPTGAATEDGQVAIASAVATLAQALGSGLSVTNFPASQTVAGTVTVGNFPATQPVSASALPLPTGAATNATLAQVLAALQATLTVAVQSFPADYPDTGSLAKLEQLRTLLAGTLAVSGPLTDTQLRATPIPNANVDDSFLVRWVLKPLARLTYTVTGLRVDCGGSSVSASIAANQDLRSVTGTVAGIGYNSQLGQAMQQSNHAFQTGFRRNLVVS